MKLTREKNREALKRYGHLKPAGFGTVRCGRRLQETKWKCTLAAGHRGPHAAHGRFGRLLAVWGSGDGSAGAAGSGRESKSPGRASKEGGRRVGPRRPVGLRSRESPGALERLKSVGSWMGEHAEEIFLLAFFAAFAWFAVDWLMIIFR